MRSTSTPVLAWAAGLILAVAASAQTPARAGDPPSTGAGAAAAAGSGAPPSASAASASASENGRVVGVAFVGRMVSNLDRSLRFYEALGFTQDPDVDSSWRRNAALDRLFGIRGTRGIEVRTAKLTINSNISGRPFTVYLRELRGIARQHLAGYQPWEPGATHFCLFVPDAEGLWARLKASGMLWARSWGGKLVAPPGRTKGVLAYLTDPDGLDIEIADASLATPGGPGRPSGPGRSGGPGGAAASARAAGPGFNHVGLIVLDSDKERGFYGDVLGGQLLTTRAPWLKGDFYDAAVGGHGNILRFYNELFPEAAAPDARMHFEMVEFQNRKKPVRRYRISDISVGYVGFQVDGLDAVLSRARAAGAKVVSRGGIVRMDDGSRAVLIRDPDVGAFLELLERPPSSH